MTIKQHLKRLVPNGVIRCLRYRRLLSVAFDAWYDFSRYVTNSSVIHFDNDEEKLRAFITATYHNLEKGLSLPAPRPSFGKENIERLFWLIDLCIDKYGPREYLATPIGALRRYVDYNRSIGADMEWVATRLDAVLKRNPPCGADPAGGTKSVRRHEIIDAIRAGGAELITSRVTCRQFAERPITQEQIQKAVQVAQSAPVVCNRQSGKVRVFTHPQDIVRILTLQGGARGFGERASALFCISVDLRNFNGTGERYQGWIDGGMFAMNLVLGLHAQGLGACCLNWSKDRHNDRKMRDLIALPDSETLIMFVAAGTLPEEYIAAKSVRKPLDEVLLDSRLA